MGLITILDSKQHSFFAHSVQLIKTFVLRVVRSVTVRG
jgi:hypothetical protein